MMAMVMMTIMIMIIIIMSIIIIIIMIIIMIIITMIIIMKVEDACDWWMPETDSWELGPKMSRPRYQVHIINFKGRVHFNIVMR